MKERKRNVDLPVANRQIKAENMQVITGTGENLGVLSRSEALRRAEEESLDLVLIAEKGAEGFPVVKIMDLGKALYTKKKKQAEAKKHQKVIQVKEVKLRPKIGEHDYITKLNHAIQFLNEGKRVKFTLVFRGRELIMKEARGQEMFGRIDETLKDAELKSELVKDRDSKAGSMWSCVYFLK